MAQILNVKVLTFLNFSHEISLLLRITTREDPILALLIFGNFDEAHGVLAYKFIYLFACDQVIILGYLMAQNSL
jgi:hypothetical protein